MELATIKNEQEDEVLRVLDSELPLLATRAAIEIDRYLNKAGVGFKSLTKLANLLKTPEIASQGEPKRPFLDLTTLTVLNQAITESQLGPNVNSVKELIDKSREIAGLMSAQSGAGNELDQWKRLKKFCIVLSNLSASYRQSLYGSTIQHPYRA